MHDTDFPPFWEITAYLISLVTSIVMILVLLSIIRYLGVGNTPLAVWGLLFGFCIILGYAGFRLGQELFPERGRKCRVCSLIRKVIEVDGVAG